MFPRFPPEGSGTTPPGRRGVPEQRPRSSRMDPRPQRRPSPGSPGRSAQKEQKVSGEGSGWEQRPIVTHLQAARLQLSPSCCQRAKDKQPSAPAADSSTSAGGSAQTKFTTPVPVQLSCSCCNPDTRPQTLLPPLHDPVHCRGVMGSTAALRSQTMQSQNCGIL